MATYDYITNLADNNDRDPINYINTNNVSYPESNMINIMGPMWLPKVYGKDLTAFEIASSGKVAITVNDVHSIDFIGSSNMDGTNVVGRSTRIKSYSNYSLELDVNDGGSYITLNSYSNNIDVHAQSNVSINASSNNITLSSGNDINSIASSNINISAQKSSVFINANNSNMYVKLDSQTSNLSIYSHSNVLIQTQDILIDANKEIGINATNNNIKLYANNSNISVTMLNADSSLRTYSLGSTYMDARVNVAMAASNNFAIYAESNISLNAQKKDITLSANASNLWVKLLANNSNLDIYSSKDVTVTACNDFTQTVGKTLTINAQSNMNTEVSFNYSLNAKSNVSINTEDNDLSLSANASNLYVRLLADTSNLDMYSSCNMTVSACNDFLSTIGRNLSYNVLSNMSTTVAFNYSLVAQSNVSLNAQDNDLNLSANNSNMYIRLLADTSNLAIYTSCNMNVTACNDFTQTVAKTLTINAQSNMTTEVAFNYALNARSNVAINAQDNDLTLSANASNMYIKLQADTSNIAMYTSCNMKVTACNDLIQDIGSNMSTSVAFNYSLNANSNVSINAKDNDLTLSANASNLYIKLLADTSNLAMYTSCNMDFTACNDFTQTVGKTLTINAQSNMTTDVAFNYALNANSNVSINAKDNDLTLSANASNLYIRLLADTSNLAMYTSCNMNISACNDFTQTVAKTLIINAQSNMSTDVAFNYALNAHSNVSINAQDNDLTLSANASNMYIKLQADTSNMSMYSSKDFGVTACNWLSLVSNRTMVLQAMSNMNVTVGYDYTLNANSNINISTKDNDLTLSANQSNLYVKFLADTSNLEVYSSSNMNTTAVSDYNLTVGKTLTVTAQSNMSTDVTYNYSLNARSNVSINAQDNDLTMSANNSNMYVKLLADSSNLAIYSSKDITISACNDYNLASKNDLYISSSNQTFIQSSNQVSITSVNDDITLQAHNSQMSLTMDAATNNTTLFGSNMVYLSASNSLSATAQNNFSVLANTGSYDLYAAKNVQLSAYNSNMYLFMNSNNKEISQYASNYMLMTSCNNFDINAYNNLNLTARNMGFSVSNNITWNTSNDYTINASNMYFTASGNIFSSAQEKMEFKILDSSNNTQPTFVVTQDKVQVRGDLEITGSINTSAILATTVVQESLKVQDKNVILANVGTSNGDPNEQVDGLATNSGAGIIIDGLPAGYSNDSPTADQYRKFFTWNYGVDGTTALGTTDIDRESFWDLQGGQFRLTRKRSYTSNNISYQADVAFGLRLNENDELEIIKKYHTGLDNSNLPVYIYKRVAKFGRIL